MITVSEVKTRLSISVSNSPIDGEIGSLLDEFQSYVRSECNDTFIDSDDNDSFPKEFDTLAVEYISKGLRKGIQSESIGDYSVAYGGSAGDFSESFKRILAKHRKVQW